MLNGLVSGKDLNKKYDFKHGELKRLADENKIKRIIIKNKEYYYEDDIIDFLREETVKTIFYIRTPNKDIREDDENIKIQRGLINEYIDKNQKYSKTTLNKYDIIYLYGDGIDACSYNRNIVFDKLFKYKVDRIITTHPNILYTNYHFIDAFDDIISKLRCRYDVLFYDYFTFK